MTDYESKCIKNELKLYALSSLHNIKQFYSNLWIVSGDYASSESNLLVQAEYWHDPLNEEEYRNKSIFLADINQERVKNPQYKENLMKLKNFVMVMFGKDTMVDPKESEWFGFYKPGQGKEKYTLQESPLYQEDWLGLKQMDSDKKLHFLTADGDHLQFTDEFFDEQILPFLK
ncbi:hypothetical protein ACROYT_G009995 [Oculina patagonica]